MEMVKVHKNGTTKTIPVDFKKAYINAGWSEIKDTNPKTIGVEKINGKED